MISFLISKWRAFCQRRLIESWRSHAMHDVKIDWSAPYITILCSTKRVPCVFATDLIRQAFSECKIVDVKVEHCLTKYNVTFDGHSFLMAVVDSQ